VIDRHRRRLIDRLRRIVGGNRALRRWVLLRRGRPITAPGRR
jgi:hypothetical protein